MGGARPSPSQAEGKMSTISLSSHAASAGGPSSTAVRPNFERLQIVATAGPCIGFLIINTLHVTMIFVPPATGVLTHAGHLILLYCASLLIGGFLSDYFNSWILFIVTVEISSLLTALLNGNLGIIVLLFFSFDVVAWLAAAKYIKKCTVPPSQQRLWWTLLTACSSTNIYLMIFGSLWQKFWYVITAILLMLLPIGYMYLYNKQLERSKDQEFNKVTLKQLRQVFFSIKSYKFWLIVVLNTILMVTKWVFTLTVLPVPSTSKEKDDIFGMKVFGGEIGIVVIGTLSAWFIHTGKLMRRETLLYVLLFMLSFALGVLIGLDRGIHHNTYLLIEFFVAFLSDGLILLTTWEIMKAVPKTVSGTALGISTVCTSGIMLSLFYYYVVSQIER